ncbi:condensation domain-containing protein, partial [Streptomyces tricolor]|nr:condensation domain-containing protein [Streptomyces tricolor]
MIARQIDYWRTALAGLPEQLELPTDRPRPAEASHRGETDPVRLGRRAARGRSSGSPGSTSRRVFMVVQSAIAAMLTRLGAGTDIPIGTAVAGRTDDALDDLVGFFINTLVLRTDTSGDPSFTELLARVRSRTSAPTPTRSCRSSGWWRSSTRRGRSPHHPLYQVMLTFQNDDAAGGAAGSGRGPGRCSLEVGGGEVRPGLRR